MSIKSIKEKGGIALILSVLVLSVLTIISLAVANMMIQQLELSRLTKESVGAYQTADSGIEYASYVANKLAYEGNGVVALDLFYNATGLSSDTVCSGGNSYWFEVNSSVGSSFCLDVFFSGNTLTSVKAVGEFMGRTRRAIQIGAQE